MKIVCTSDIHFNMKKTKRALPDGDVLIVAGDSLLAGTASEYRVFNNWISKLDYQLKIVIAGNHDFILDDKLYRHFDDCVFLHDSEYVWNGIKFYGSPWTPRFGPFVFMKPRGEELKQIWREIPTDVDVLITHGPPFGILDYCGGGHVGCEDLLFELERGRINPKLHVFGHIHPANGIVEKNQTIFVNAALSDDFNRYTYQPRVIELEI